VVQQHSSFPEKEVKSVALRGSISVEPGISSTKTLVKSTHRIADLPQILIVFFLQKYIS
jgi:hypothetical protein